MMPFKNRKPTWSRCNCSNDWKRSFSLQVDPFWIVWVIKVSKVCPSRHILGGFAGILTSKIFWYCPNKNNRISNKGNVLSFLSQSHWFTMVIAEIMAKSWSWTIRSLMRSSEFRANQTGLVTGKSRLENALKAIVIEENIKNEEFFQVHSGSLCRKRKEMS